MMYVFRGPRPGETPMHQQHYLTNDIYHDRLNGQSVTMLHVRVEASDLFRRVLHHCFKVTSASVCRNHV